MKIYISGPMEGKDYKNRFAMAEFELTKAGHTVANPARVVKQHMTITERQEATKELQELCDTVLMLEDWQNDTECNVELARAIHNKMTITFEGGKGCQNPSRPEHGTSQKKPVKKFMSAIKDAFSVKWGTILPRK